MAMDKSDKLPRKISSLMYLPQYSFLLLKNNNLILSVLSTNEHGKEEEKKKGHEPWRRRRSTKPILDQYLQ